MARITALLLAALVGCAPHEGAGSRRACFGWPGEAQPLLVGDTMRLSAGTLHNDSDCIPPPPQRVGWSSAHPAVASVDSEGLVRGLSPGRFTAVGVAGSDTLLAEGFVLPHGWTARVIPDSVTARVGDSVSVVVVAFDSLGRQLPTVPYWIFTPEWQSRRSTDTVGQAIPPRLTTEHVFANVTTPSVFHLEQAGTTTLIGRLGEKRLIVTLVVQPAPAPDQ